MSGMKTLKKNEILFREGDSSDAMYVIKSGKIAITKAKGSSEIVLAELKAGDMLGEMAFFDNKPRSAGAKALSDTVVIELPFKALNAQFKTFPEWLKAIVRTVNTHLRNANQKIKNLEKTAEDEVVYFPPHTVTRLIGILGLVASRFGEKTEDGVVVPSGTLRRYTIQIFQQPTAKMQKLMEVLQAFAYMKVEDLGEGRQRITVKDPNFLLAFVDFYNDWLFKSEDKRVTIDEKELKPAKALLFYGSRIAPDDKGEVKVNLTQMQNDAMRDLGQMFSVDDVNSLSEKGVIGEKMSGDGGLALKFNLVELQTNYPYWEMIYAFKKVTRD
jgi:CRP/FNR family transcriptional regulator, cyclic AMP receptor protein